MFCNYIRAKMLEYSIFDTALFLMYIITKSMVNT